MKDTRLDETASIYNHKETKTEKEKWNSLSNKGKLQYFKDYYFKYILIGIIFLIGIISILHTVISKKDTVFTLTIVNGTMTSEEIEDLSTTLSKKLEINPHKEEVLIDQSLYTDSTSSLSTAANQKLSVYSYSGQYDIIIAERSIFEEYASYEYFSNLEDLLPSELKDCFSDSFLGVTPYGISLKNNKTFKELTKNMDNPVLAIFQTSNHKENAIRFLQSFVLE